MSAVGPHRLHQLRAVRTTRVSRTSRLDVSITTARSMRGGQSLYCLSSSWNTICDCCAPSRRRLHHYIPRSTTVCNISSAAFPVPVARLLWPSLLCLLPGPVAHASPETTLAGRCSGQRSGWGKLETRPDHRKSLSG